MTVTEQVPDLEDDEDLMSSRPSRRFSLVSGFLALVLVGGGAFFAGVQVQKHHDRNLTTTTSLTAGSNASTRSATGGTGSGTGGRSGFGGATVGQVKLVDGSTIYVTDTSGNTVTVLTTNASTFTKQQSVTLKDIHPGDTVVIRGATQPDGSVSATAVNDSGSASLAGLGGFGAGRGTGGTGATGAGTSNGAGPGGAATNG